MSEVAGQPGKSGKSPVPWLRILGMVLDVAAIARGSRGRAARGTEPDLQLSPSSPALGHLETRLAGVVVAALREAFDRDTRRLELEREHIEADRAHAERVLGLELTRQAGEREIGRLRLVAGLAAASWFGTLFFSTRLIGTSVGLRVMMAVGWILLLAALAAAFVGQARIVRALDPIDDLANRRAAIASGLPGALAPWLVVVGLAIIALAVVVS